MMNVWSEKVRFDGLDQTRYEILRTNAFFTISMKFKNNEDESTKRRFHLNRRMMRMSREIEE